MQKPFSSEARSDIRSLFCDKEKPFQQDHVRKRMQVMERVIDIVKVIGKCCLGHREHLHEAAYNLENMSVSYGNFRELLLSLSKYDICLQEHVKNCIENSKKLTACKERGSYITMIYRTTVNKIL